MVVVGAGIVGAATARALARAGAEVVVLDRGPSAGGTSSGGEGNLLVSDKGPGAELDLSLRSLELWRRLDEELRDELPTGFPSLEFDPKGGVVVATTPAGAAGLAAFAADQRAVGIRAEDVAGEVLRDLEPDLTPQVELAVHYPDDAQVQPVVATEALLAAARVHGAVVHQHREVLAPLLTGGRITGVRTAAGDVHGDAVVVAAGPWSAEVSARLGVRVPVKPRRGTVLVTARMPQRIHHKVYDADYVGAVGSGSAELQTSSVVESTPAGTVLIGSSRERRGFDDRFEGHVLAELARKAIALFPFLADVHAMRAYGGFRPFVPDHLPLIGEDPRLPGLFHATGHEGAGIGLCLGTAEIVEGLVHGRTGVALADEFALTRPSLAPHLQEVLS